MSTQKKSRQYMECTHTGSGRKGYILKEDRGYAWIILDDTDGEKCYIHMSEVHCTGGYRNVKKE